MKKIKHLLNAFVREWLLPAAFLFVFVAPLRSMVVDWNWVPTGSMKPTILEGDLVLVNKLAYDLKVPFTTHHLSTWSSPSRGDIVVFYSPADGTRLVKRVVGLPGDVVVMHDDVLTINGVELSYQPMSAAFCRSEVFEDTNPIVAQERLGEKWHWVLALPHRGALRNVGPYTVPAGKYFVMGDSRDNSADSRYFGFLDRDRIVGRATTVLVSLNENGWWMPRFSRFFHALDPQHG